MTERATFSIDNDTFAFLQSAAGNNRSAFINRLLKEEKKRTLDKLIAQANREEAEDSEYQNELAEWDIALADGLNS
jgi:hypothetical protein